MAKIGKFLEKRFKNKEVHLYSGMDREWITYADSSMINGTVVTGIFSEYDEECGVLIMKTLNQSGELYISEDSIEMFWAPGFKILENTITIMNTGQRVFNGKNRDIM